MSALRIVQVCWDTALSLNGSRVLLRPLTTDDIGEHYVAWLGNPQVTCYLEERLESHSLEQIRRQVQTQNASSSTLLLGIFLRADGRHIGNIQLSLLNGHHGYGVLSYYIGDVALWGSGLATEAVELLAEFAFTEMGLHRLQAGCYAENISSARVLEKAGFSREGVWKQAVKDHSGKWQDHVWFRLLEDEWRFRTF